MTVTSHDSVEIMTVTMHAHLKRDMQMWLYSRALQLATIPDCPPGWFIVVPAPHADAWLEHDMDTLRRVANERWQR